MWSTILFAALRWLILCFTIWRERSATKKAIKKAGRKMLSEGIKTRDPAKITAAYDKVRRASWVVLLVILFLGGCGRGIWLRLPFTSEPPIVLHPITPTHIFSIPKGARVEWPDMNDIDGDLIFVEEDGWFISDFYMREIMESKVE